MKLVGTKYINRSETIKKCLVMSKILVKIEHPKIAFVRFELRDLVSLETVMNIDEICILIFGNLKKTYPTAQKHVLTKIRKHICIEF